MSVFRGAGGGSGGLKDTAGNPVTFSGCDIRSFRASAASTHSERLKNSAGTFEGVKGRNTAAYPVFVHIYDSIANPPLVNAATAKDVYEFPAGSLVAWEWSGGIKMATGIGMAICKADGSAVAAGDLINFALLWR